MIIDTIYSIEECTDDKYLFKVLEGLKDNELISYRKIDSYNIQITDSDLSAKEEKDLMKTFKDLSVYVSEEDGDDWDSSFDDFDGDYDGDDY